MTSDPTPTADTDTDTDPRSDIQQAVESRADEAARADDRTDDPPIGIGGESGAGGVVKNQEGLDQ